MRKRENRSRRMVSHKSQAFVSLADAPPCLNLDFDESELDGMRERAASVVGKFIAQTN